MSVRHPRVFWPSRGILTNLERINFTTARGDKCAGATAKNDMGPVSGNGRARLWNKLLLVPEGGGEFWSVDSHGPGSGPGAWYPRSLRGQEYVRARSRAPSKLIQPAPRGTRRTRKK